MGTGQKSTGDTLARCDTLARSDTLTRRHFSTELQVAQTKYMVENNKLAK